MQYHSDVSALLHFTRQGTAGNFDLHLYKDDLGNKKPVNPLNKRVTGWCG